jgi:hypothetical protein
LGVAQTVGSLARVLGPPFATGLYYFRPALPYLICAGVAVVACFITWHYLHRPGERSLRIKDAAPGNVPPPPAGA